jgi:hypothetical protein
MDHGIVIDVADATIMHSFNSRFEGNASMADKERASFAKRPSTSFEPRALVGVTTKVCSNPRTLLNFHCQRTFSTRQCPRA